jgi:hypothetical protein
MPGSLCETGGNTSLRNVVLPPNYTPYSLRNHIIHSEGSENFKSDIKVMILPKYAGLKIIFLGL